jgi:hypothetical protein
MNGPDVGQSAGSRRAKSPGFPCRGFTVGKYDAAIRRGSASKKKSPLARGRRTTESAPDLNQSVKGALTANGGKGVDRN